MEAVAFSPWKAKGDATPRRWLNQFVQCSPSSSSVSPSGQRLRLSDATSPSVKQQKSKKRKRMGGAHSDVFIVRSNRPRASDETGGRRLYAIKRQALITPDGKERAVREQRIAAELKKLVYRSMCGNFVLLHDWNLCETSIEPAFAPPTGSPSSSSPSSLPPPSTPSSSSSSSSSSPSSSSSFSSPSSSSSTPLNMNLKLRGKSASAEQITKMGWLGGTPVKSPVPARSRSMPSMLPSPGGQKYEFMHFVMEFGERTLANCHREVDLAQYREILWQVFYALHVAGSTFSFTHYDLHHKNILLCSLPVEDGCYVYYYKGVPHYNRLVIVKIADFGLSRITTEEGEVLYNTKDAHKEAYSPGIDVMSVAKWPWRNPNANKDDPTHKELLSLRKLMLKGVRPAVLLSHSFFAPLKEVPESFSVERCIAVSNQGMDGIPAEMHSRALMTCAPPTPSVNRGSGTVARSEVSSTPRSATPTRIGSPAAKSSPGTGFIVPASPYHRTPMRPSALRRSFQPTKPAQPFSPSTTSSSPTSDAKPMDNMESESPQKECKQINEPKTPSTTLNSAQPAPKRLAKRKRPLPPAFAATADKSEEDKENRPLNGADPEEAEVSCTNSDLPVRDPEVESEESTAVEEEHRPRRSVRPRRAISAFSPSEKKPRLESISARRKAKRMIRR